MGGEGLEEIKGYLPSLLLEEQTIEAVRLKFLFAAAKFVDLYCDICALRMILCHLSAATSWIAYWLPMKKAA